MNGITIISKYHNEWTKIVQSFGNYKYPEDIVQDMYIKLFNTNNTKYIVNNEPNRAYIWITLRNIYISSVKCAKLVDIEQVITIADEPTPLIKEVAFVKLVSKVESNINELNDYDKLLLNTYIKTGISIRNLAKKSHISARSIAGTLKTCYDKIRVNVGEDYQDYKNKDYELI